jgi:hypothetical protein
MAFHTGLLWLVIAAIPRAPALPDGASPGFDVYGNPS